MMSGLTLLAAFILLLLSVHENLIAAGEEKENILHRKGLSNKKVYILTVLHSFFERL